MNATISTGNKLSVGILAFSTFTFAINTYSIFAIFQQTASELDEGIVLLGFITTSTFLGAGLFQVPAGILAARFGPKKIATLGTSVIAATTVMTSLATDGYQVVIFRFFLGVGTALFLPSAIVFASGLARKGFEGTTVGVITGALAFGGIVSYFGWVLLALEIGWRTSLLVGGLMAIAAAVLLGLASRTQLSSPKLPFSLSELRSVLGNRFLIALGAVFVGVQVANEGTSGFIVFYLEDYLKIEPATAGLVGSLTFVGALFGSVLGGRMYDRLGNLRLLILIFGVLLAIGVGINFLGSVYATVCGALLVGFAGVASLTVLSTTAAVNARVRKEYATLSVNYVHGMGLTAAFFSPIMFSSIVTNTGYPIAWLTAGFVSFAFIISLTLSKVLSRNTGRA